jgi:hypothetical protein
MDDACINGDRMTRIWTLSADYEQQPERHTIDRVGGRPVGVDDARWPRFQGKAMSHVLTVDLRDRVPALAREWRAAALFLHSPDYNEAYEPETEQSCVVLLSEAEVARGEAPAEAGSGAELLRAGVLRLEPADGMDRETLYQHSFLGGEPIWLQDEEGDSESFILQFDEELVSINLGDCGIMYMFDDAAWWQCH